MEVIVANIDMLQFKIEAELNDQIGAYQLPFSGMDKSTSAVCQFFNQGKCDKDLCPFRHMNLTQKTIVCKHWLRALCKKGDSCEFLHEYDMTKMPECYFYSRFNTCHKKECTFLHIDPESKIKDCAWYDRGFCRHGPSCRHRHVRRVLCKNYLAGFCPDGSGCKFMHPRFELPPVSDITKDPTKRPPVCHNCGELGHKASFCPKLPPEQREILERQNMMRNPPIYNHHLQQKLREQKEHEGGDHEQMQTDGPNQSPQHPIPMSGPPPNMMHGGPPHFHQNQNGPRPPFQHRKLEDITCFKCGMKGHYANRCYSFLNNNFSGGNKTG